MIFCRHDWVYDYPPATNARYCKKCGKTQSGHIIYERWINQTFLEGEFLVIFGHEMPQVVKERG